MKLDNNQLERWN